VCDQPVHILPAALSVLAGVGGVGGLDVVGGVSGVDSLIILIANFMRASSSFCFSEHLFSSPETVRSSVSLTRAGGRSETTGVAGGVVVIITSTFIAC